MEYFIYYYYFYYYYSILRNLGSSTLSIKHYCTPFDERLRGLFESDFNRHTPRRGEIQINRVGVVRDDLLGHSDTKTSFLSV